jgi:NADPH:quinone reductase-like Zn-dependent oxidoreductase
MEAIRNHRVVVSEHGGPDVLILVDDDLPEPGAGEVRVKVLAAGVSAFDLIYRRWAHLPGSPPLPFTPGEDVVGVVDAWGEGVSSPERGQLVAAGTWVLGVGGGYSEHVCLPARELVAVPPGVDPAEAVCLVVNYLTAHQHLHEIGRVRDGERMLVHGAAGGVGTGVVQLGRQAGLEVFGTAATDQLDVVAALGATPIDYRTEDFLERIRSLTGDGVDVVIDPVGGARHLWRSYRALRRGGRLVWLGSAAVKQQGLRVGPSSMLTMLLLRLIPDGRQAPRCPTLATFAEAHHDWYRETLVELLARLAAGDIEPIVAERVPLAEAARAHELLESHRHVGKVVLVTDAYEDDRTENRPDRP